MFDEVPAQVWLLIGIAAAAFVPVRYVYSHVVKAPRARDITLPLDDLSWRTSCRLIGSLGALVALGALAVFIFTPTAEEFARSPSLWPALITAFGAFAFFTVAKGLSQGRIEPLVRGLSSSYERQSQPKRFWASLSWNALLGCLCVWIAFEMAAEAPKERCYDFQENYTPQQVVSSCDVVISEGFGTQDERASLFTARGVAHHRLGNHPRALEDYSAAIALDPDNSYAYYNRGLIHAVSGEPLRAVADYNASLKLRPDNADGYLNRGLILLEAGRLDQAIIDFTRAHELRPDDPLPIANRGIAYVWKEDRSSAERDFQSVRAIDPANVIMLRCEALIDLRAGRYTAAIERLSKALRFHPRDGWSLRARADAYWRLGEKEKAWADDDEVSKLQTAVQKALQRN